ncbi:ABC transporter ATP-binding protein [Mesorhizobium sp. C420B]|uniref:ABC transporter ATP-binding protein n=1 Tax=unclassified Mesorhizobium TaxID=325217 RepID=UPI0018DB9793|nr:ABC transporter ATP-binding protein [Mesorhizobium sp. LSHC420B00]
MARLGIPDPEDRYHCYPRNVGWHAAARDDRAGARGPTARADRDEPTTALDATVQAQILELIRQIQREEGIAVVLVTHNIAVVASVADRVIVLYAGQVAEEGIAMDVLTRPVHPYTRGLPASVPDFRSDERATTREIPGLPPSQIRLEPGCRFADRCELVEPGCRKHRPPLQSISVSANPHRVACPVVIRREGIAVHV